MCPDLEKTNCYLGGASGKESARQYRRQKRHSFDPWVRKIPWSREWQPIPIFLPGEFHGQRNLAGYSPWVAESNMTERLTLCCTIHSLLFSSMSFDKCIQPCGNHHCDIEQFHHFPQFFVLFVVNLSSHLVLSNHWSFLNLCSLKAGFWIFVSLGFLTYQRKH